MAYHGVTVEHSLDALGELFKADIDPKRVAAIIIEPVLGEGGFYAAPAELLRKLREVCNQHGIVLIADEVQSGFGRTGRLFAIEHAGVEPDLMTVAKSIAGGVPLSAVIGKADIMDTPEAGALGGTFAGSPLACAAGLMLPGIYIKRRVAARQAELEREFPDALDLMVVCIEAGLGLDAAFVRIGQAMGRSHPAIAAELTRLSEELAAGKGRSEAMRAMAMRAGVSSIRSFVALIIQSEMLGASVALTFRTYAAEMRQARYLAAERRAMRIPVLMTLPLVTCILPVIVAALLLPVIIDVVRHLMPALSGVHGVG